MCGPFTAHELQECRVASENGLKFLQTKFGRLPASKNIETLSFSIENAFFQIFRIHESNFVDPKIIWNSHVIPNYQPPDFSVVRLA